MFEVRRVSNVEEVYDNHIAFGIKENWNGSYGDALSIYSQDPKGFFLGLVDHKPIAAIQIAKYDSSYAHIATYIVLKEYRKMGYGKKLWDRAWEHVCKDDITIGLDGVEDMQGAYQNLGFVPTFKSCRYRSTAGQIAEISKDLNRVDIIIKNARNVDFEDLVTFDTKHVGAPRSVFLKNMIERQDAHSAVAFDPSGRMIGFAILRQSIDGYKFAQFYAERTDVAQELFINLCERVPQKSVFIFIDQPIVSRGNKDLHEIFNMELIARCARMLYNPSDAFKNLPLDNIYGTIWEFG
ncbi:N-acetyltransferase [Acrasis kona]|uniref:N-acetyltransferase n=1 Tax=Acrasis kona TaxID=1008807 RepID=A0AAW2ZFY0_9EUKA